MPFKNEKPPMGAALPPDVLLASLVGKDKQNGLVGAMRTEPTPRQAIGTKEIQEAASILTRYKQGKANLESRIVEDELWWEGRHWEVIRGKRSVANELRAEPSSSWLFNCIMNKHADAMDNYPEPVVLPRERSDEESAKTLSSVLPVIMEYNDFEQTYSDNWWEKLKHGTAAYGVFWDNKKDNGLGDVDIHEIDLLKLFWEPGITDIQKSRNLFVVELVDEDILDSQYPEHRGKMKGGTIDVKEYLYDDQVDNSQKAVVVDWYYKKTTGEGRTTLHYAKFVGDVLLYASENDPGRENGWYEHGLYPVVLDVLFPEKGTPIGFGYVAICKDPQMYIDKLFGTILDYANEAANPRWWVSEHTAVNEDEFLDKSNRLVHVAGELDERRLKQIEMAPISDIYVQIAQLKIEEMKDTAANRDVNSGSSGSGVTAAAAIVALQEAGNKASRDMISASYRADVQICSQTVELARQFYDEARNFRITNQTGDYQFVELSNERIKEQIIGTDSEGFPLYRKPIFDLKIKAQKKNPFSRMEQNEMAKELFKLGFFNPERAQEVLPALDMMEFEGIEKVREQVNQGMTLLNMVMQLNQKLDQMAMIVQNATGMDMGLGQPGMQQPQQGGQRPPSQGQSQSVGTPMERKASNAKKATMTSYGQRLAQRSSTDVNKSSNAAMPGGR